MVAPAVGAVVLVPFPFSDKSQAKLRPAVVLAKAGRGDWILGQITSNAYGDAQAIELTTGSFTAGSLRMTSYARPGKLFTANRDLMTTEVGVLRGVPREVFFALSFDGRYPPGTGAFHEGFNADGQPERAGDAF
jgi:mRNA interferase MazF